PAQQIEKRGNVQFLLVIAGVGLHQIEEQIILASSQPQQSFVGAVQDLVAGLMAQLFQGFIDLFEIVLLAAFLLLLSPIALLLVGLLLRFGEQLFIAPVLVKNRDF